ncbi:hypothetical protein KAR91_87030 [Candidatus Pacearchaeota archaeon]|nr:hypothetical protein [Candidatus Pacearchaeota archaeon]
MKRLDVGSLGCSIHTALRKCCDSNTTSLAYNLIHGAGKEWSLFLKLIHSNMSETSDLDKMIVEVKSIINRMDDGDIWPEDEDLQSRGDNKHQGANECLFWALLLTFKLFNDDEWRGVLYFST